MKVTDQGRKKILITHNAFGIFVGPLSYHDLLNFFSDRLFLLCITVRVSDQARSRRLMKEKIPALYFHVTQSPLNRYLRPYYDFFPISVNFDLFLSWKFVSFGYCLLDIRMFTDNAKLTTLRQ